MYDYLVVGAGLYGSVFAYEANKAGKKVLVIDKKDHIGGNVYTQNVNGINVHKYGAHIFHTDDVEIWNYINKFAEFNNYINEPIANYKGQIYNMPFNMNTFSKMWDITTPLQAREIISKQIEQAGITNPTNLEEQAISMVGTDVYEKLVKGYTEKQWGKDCKDLPKEIIKRIPLRFVYNNNYFNDKYQGIPIGGYTQIKENMLNGIEVRLGVDFIKNKDLSKLAKKVVYTGMIDEYFDYCFGELEYRSLEFKTERINVQDYQGNAVVNYTERKIPYTRIIEHKHFEFLSQNNDSINFTLITKEYPKVWKKGLEPYYPINNKKNAELYKKYQELANSQDNVVFGGRLGLYKYFDMDDTIIEALKFAKGELNG